MQNAPSLQRMTRQRKILLEVLERKNWHPTAEELYAVVREKAPRISLGTVYRNLDIMTRQGLVITLEETGRQRRYDGNPKPHFHALCTECGEVSDVHPAEVSWDAPPDVLRPDFVATGYRLIFTGYCAKCARPVSRPADFEE